MYDTPCVLYIYIYPFIEYPIECLIGYFLNSPIENLTDKGFEYGTSGNISRSPRSENFRLSYSELKNGFL